jgi:hypothetical protein
MSRPRVPFTPEPLAALRKRYPAAIAELVDQGEVLRGREPSPSGDRAHVFDALDGLRLIVSRERTPDGRTCVHVSGSVGPEPIADALHAEMVASGNPALAFVGLCRRRWRELAESTRWPELLGITAQKGIPHFAVWDES